jgi:aryl-alcohol dehydrogenase-like predicted oxidoreductase
MKTLPLGDTGVDVSALCLGIMYFGTRTDEQTSRDLMDQYYEAGGRFLDTANVYAHWTDEGQGGESERLLARWLKDRGCRDEVFIASKVGFAYSGDELGGAEQTLKADVIVRECDKSLQRMGIDTIDLYYAHNDDRDTPLEETLGAFDKLVKAGKVRFIGASNTVSWRLAEALCTSEHNDFARYVAIQQKCTYLRSQRGVDYQWWPPASEELLQCCKHRKVTAVAYSPLLRGAYTRKDKDIGDAHDTAENHARLAALYKLAEDRGVTANQLVLAWMIHHDPPILPLFSVSNSEQMAENLGALDISLSEQEMETLDKASA